MMSKAQYLSTPKSFRPNESPTEKQVSMDPAWDDGSDAIFTELAEGFETSSKLEDMSTARTRSLHDWQKPSLQNLRIYSPTSKPATQSPVPSQPTPNLQLVHKRFRAENVSTDLSETVIKSESPGTTSGLRPLAAGCCCVVAFEQTQKDMLNLRLENERLKQENIGKDREIIKLKEQRTYKNKEIRTLKKAAESPKHQRARTEQRCVGSPRQPAAKDAHVTQRKAQRTKQSKEISSPKKMDESLKKELKEQRTKRLSEISSSKKIDDLLSLKNQLGLKNGLPVGRMSISPDSRPMTFDEKQRLSVDVNRLHGERLERVVNIILKSEPDLKDSDPMDLEIDFELLQTSTLRQLEAYIGSVIDVHADEIKKEPGLFWNQKSENLY